MCKKDWPTLKPTFAFGQVPVLDIVENGNTFTLAQSGAIGFEYLDNLLRSYRMKYCNL